MTHIIDLDILVNEPIQFKIQGDVYTIPSSPSTDVFVKMVSLEKRRVEAKEEEEHIKILDDMCQMILSQDTDQKVTKEFVSKKLSLSQKLKICDVYESEIRKVESDPN